MMICECSYTWRAEWFVDCSQMVHIGDASVSVIKNWPIKYVI